MREQSIPGRFSACLNWPGNEARRESGGLIHLLGSHNYTLQVHFISLIFGTVIPTYFNILMKCFTLVIILHT